MEIGTSEVFVKSKNVEWESAGDGVQRQILGFDDGIMLVRVVFEQGAVGDLHHHPHRQVSYVESGIFEVQVEGEKVVLGKGDGFYIPPGAVHGAVALEKGCLIDVFAPARQEFIAPPGGDGQSRDSE